MTFEEVQKIINGMLTVQQQIVTQQSEHTLEMVELRKLIASNAKSIASLSSNLVQLSDEVRVTQRQMRDSLRRIDASVEGGSFPPQTLDLQADTRELMLENKRILRYLESRDS